MIPSLEYLSSKRIHLWNQISDLNRNNFGLLEKQDFGRNFNRAEKFHFAIVGGSVASQVFNHLKNKEEGFRTKEGKQIEFVNLSYGG